MNPWKPHCEVALGNVGRIQFGHSGVGVTLRTEGSARDERGDGEQAQALLSPQAPRSHGDCSDFCHSLFAACAGCGFRCLHPTKVGILSQLLL